MAASGRYKSRLLNYMVEQSQKLSEQAGHRLRQARTGFVWGAQVLLYPLYVAFQSSRVVGRRLSQGGPMPGRQARLTPPSADDVLSSVLKLARDLADEGAITISADPQPIEQPIEQPSLGEMSGQVTVTASVNQLQEIPVEAFANQASVAGQSIDVTLAPSPHPKQLKSANPNDGHILVGGVDIRGVASQLGNRALVLVDNGNRVVPLESEQQWNLQQTIVQQVADFNYRRQRYSQQLALAEAGDRPLPLPQPRTKQFSGVRWMAHLMGWMQTSDLAQSTNLFKESQLAHQLAGQVAAPPFLYWDPEPGQRLTRETLAQLDSPLAGLEQRYIKRDEQDDTATKALRFTAKLFGLEEAADQWLRASAAAKAAENGHAPQNANHPTGLRPGMANSPLPPNPLSDNPIPGTIHGSWSSADPWGDYTGQLQGQAPHSVEPQQASVPQNPSSPQNNLPPASAVPQPKNPQGWLSSLLKPDNSMTAGVQPPPASSPSNGDASPKGWQRLTTRFGGLLQNLKSPAGPIAPFNPQGQPPATPPAAAPNNDNIGISQNASQSPKGSSGNSNTAPGNLAQAGLSDPQIEAAWQKRVANAKAQGGALKSENVTLRSSSKGAQPVAAAMGEQATENPAEAADPHALQTAENSVTYDSPYIETTAQFNGYERHPLEIVLDQLDQILLWIEELGLRLWRWLTNAGEQ